MRTTRAILLLPTLLLGCPPNEPASDEDTNASTVEETDAPSADTDEEATDTDAGEEPAAEGARLVGTWGCEASAESPGNIFEITPCTLVVGDDDSVNIAFETSETVNGSLYAIYRHTGAGTVTWSADSNAWSLNFTDVTRANITQDEQAQPGEAPAYEATCTPSEEGGALEIVCVNIHRGFDADVILTAQ